MSNTQSNIKVPPTEAFPALPVIWLSVQVTDAQLARYAELIYRRTGIRVSPQKKTLLTNRLRRRMREQNIEDFDEYYRYLCSLPANHPEWDAFCQEITTHETYLFRDETHWDWFRKEFLAVKIQAVRAGQQAPRLTIWSAACSTGDEPITAACCIAATILDLNRWDIKILGTDIGSGALEQARRAIYGERAMRLVPEDYRKRFFVKLGNEPLWQARPILTQMIVYRQHNLLEPIRHPPFDVVLLKNVLIYFDQQSKAQVLAHVKSVISPGGYLVTGAAEGIGEWVREFVRIRPWLFQRPK